MYLINRFHAEVIDFYQYLLIITQQCLCFCFLTSITIILKMQPQTRIYYKGNPHTRNNYVPASALRNRPKAQYLVQFPQGADHFSPTRKKQYSLLHNQSEIKESRIFEGQAGDYHHGTLYVSDIEGAVPGTLVSQAVRNRMRGRGSQGDTSEVRDYVDERTNRQEQREDRARMVNYHMRDRVQTEPVQNYASYNQNREKFNPEVHNLSKNAQAYEDRIKQLEDRLFSQQTHRLKPVTLNRQLEHIGRTESIMQLVNHTPKVQPKLPPVLNHGNQSLKEIKPDDKATPTRVKLYPHNQIRKFNPTYLSTENYIGSEQAYFSKYFRQNVM